MDRPARIGRILDAGAGLRSIGSRDPVSLESLSQKLFADLLAINRSKFVAGMHLGGGGGGADWQVSYTVTTSEGLGFAGTSCWIGKARVRFREATDAAELDRVALDLLTEIQQGYPNANVYDVQTCGSGRDGTYLVGILFGEYNDPPPFISDEQTAEQGPYDTETGVCGPIRCEPTPDWDDQSTFLLDWGCIFQETGNAGIFIRLQFSVGAAPGAPWTTIREVTCTAGVIDWRGCGGVARVLQPVGDLDAAQWYRLAVAANPPTTITVRNTYLHLLRVGSNGEIS